MALLAYEVATNRLLHNSAYLLYPQVDIDAYINSARSRIALESETTQNVILVATGAAGFIALSSLSVAGIAGAANVALVRGIVRVGVGLLEFRPWNWFWSYYYGSGNAGAPAIWSQIGVGTAGIILFWPTGTDVNLSFDCIVSPISLVDDTTAEMLVYPWTDAIPYYAAHLALLNAQRSQDAEEMFQMFERKMLWARQSMTPTELVGSWPGTVGTRAARMMAGSLAVPMEQPKGRGS